MTVQVKESTKDDPYYGLRLENQLCFPIYACAREIIRAYKPYLDKLDLTYTQYLTMLLLWEEKEYSVGELGERLYLDSGTLTPLLKKLESKGLVSRKRSAVDERARVIAATPKGMALRDVALKVPGEVAPLVAIEWEEARNLYKTLYKILEGFSR